jgi:tetratricopeptide (TPR) repeat protein
LAVVDGLVARGDVTAAERVLRGFITRHVPSILLNRYILLLEADVWVPHSPSRASLRRATFAFFEAKVCELGLAPIAVSAPGEFVHTGTADDKFVGEAVSVNVLARVRQACRKWDQDSRAPASEHSAPAAPGSASAQVQVHSQVQVQVKVHVHRHWLRTGTASTEAACILAYMCFKDQQFEAARSLATFALEHDPVHALAHWVDGLIAHYVSRDFPRAARAYAEALVAAPDFAHAYFSLGMLCADCRDHGMTRWLHGRCLFVDPNHHLALISQAFYLPCDGPEFLRQVRRVIKIHPTDPFCHGVVALLVLKRARHVEPGADKRGAMREYLQAVSEAEVLLRRAIELSPVDTGRNWLALGYLYLDHFCGRARDAAACCLRVLEICSAAEQRGECDVAGAKMRDEATRVLRMAGRRTGRGACGQ